MNKHNLNNKKPDELNNRDEKDKNPDIEFVERKDAEIIEVSKAEYDQLKADAQQAKENWDRLLRQQADFENIRKRLERDKQEFQKYAHEDIIVDLLGILDDLERSVEAAEKKQENFDAFLKGIEMILAHFYELLKKRGVTPVVAKGQKFDPHQHEALVQTETSDHGDDEVIEELQKGYSLNDKIIRTAKVRVAKNLKN